MNLLNSSEWPLWLVIAVFATATATILFAGIRITRAADRLADMTGLGEALFGAVLLGGATSLSGVVTSVTAAWEGYADLAISNAIGGIAAQTMFLAVADVTYRRANLEHAAASLENLLQGSLLLILLAVPLLLMSGPEVSWVGIHPGSLLLVLAYVFGTRLIGVARTSPLWRAHRTPETRIDEPADSEPGERGRLLRTWTTFAALAAGVGIAGYFVAQTGITLANRTGISQTLVGAFLTAVATSLPELVTSVAAVRAGALTLAVGGVIGGNTFDILFVAFADVFYRGGSIYHALSEQQVFVIAESMILTGILLLGLLRREKHGIANIGFESVLVMVVYFGSLAVLAFG